MNDYIETGCGIQFDLFNHLPERVDEYQYYVDGNELLDILLHELKRTILIVPIDCCALDKRPAGSSICYCDCQQCVVLCRAVRWKLIR